LIAPITGEVGKGGEDRRGWIDLFDTWQNENFDTARRLLDWLTHEVAMMSRI
jgi:hypothetical protein